MGVKHALLRSTIERHNAFPDDPVQYRGGWALDAAEFWAMAGARPEDVDVLETYDDYPVIVMMQIEDLGFCEKGEAPAFVRAHDLRARGDFPHNTSGGQLSCRAGRRGGRPSRARRGAPAGDGAGARRRRSPGARRAVVSGFGMINYDRGPCSGAAFLGGSMSARSCEPKACVPLPLAGEGRGEGRLGLAERCEAATGTPTPALSHKGRGIASRRRDPRSATRCSPRVRQSRCRPRAAARRLGSPCKRRRGAFALQVCGECGAAQYPPRDVCGTCLSVALKWRDVDPRGPCSPTRPTRISERTLFPRASAVAHGPRRARRRAEAGRPSASQLRSRRSACGSR